MSESLPSGYTQDDRFTPPAGLGGLLKTTSPRATPANTATSAAAINAARTPRRTSIVRRWWT
jgi:hypothetical protein